MSDTTIPRDSSSELRQRLIRFSRYANGLTPYKLDEPLDPIVGGAIDDFVNELQRLISQEAYKFASEVIGDDLDEGDGWDWAFGEEAKCCPGDDFAYFGNHIKKLQRLRLDGLRKEGE